ncbi:MAG TPA: DUF4382 domain-containing protein [Gemmatimonadota bacterium]|nr:DUF4382 domain-containing protein [Gemmatimonadota bacterium]
MFAAPLFALGAVACEDSTSPADGTGQFSVALTDAPSAMFAEAVVDIGAIQLVGGEGPPITLTNDGGVHDLLELQNGVMADLATLDIEAGTYHQLRLIVESAQVTLAEGFEFADGTTTRTLFVPSGAQTGVKVNLRYADADESAGVEISSGETILVVLDMDVEQNFVLQGDPDGPSGLLDVLFTPLLRASILDVAGSISGTVTYTSATPADETEFASIQAELDESTSLVLEEMQTTTVATTAAADGTYTLWFVSPGTYDVSASATIGGTMYSDGPQTVPVSEDEDVTAVDFDL